MDYYLGGYYLVRMRAIRGTVVYTASDHINDTLLGDWAYPWIDEQSAQSSLADEEIPVDDHKLQLIRHWVSERFERQVGWGQLFYDIDTARSYRSAFFPDLANTVLVGLYFSEDETTALLDAFKPTHEDRNGIGLYELLSRKIMETSSADEQAIGFDLTGVEFGGLLHSFHCHSLADDLEKKFSIRLNSYGLINDIPDHDAIATYLNDENTGLMSVPWFITKVKLTK